MSVALQRDRAVGMAELAGYERQWYAAHDAAAGGVMAQRVAGPALAPFAVDPAFGPFVVDLAHVVVQRVEPCVGYVVERLVRARPSTIRVWYGQSSSHLIACSPVLFLRGAVTVGNSSRSR